MIKWLSVFLNKYGDLILFLTGFVLCLTTLGLQLKGINEYKYYDLRRFNKVIELSVNVNYIVGGSFMLFSFKKSWWWTWRKWMQRRRDSTYK